MAQTAVEKLVNYMKDNFHLTDEALQKFEEAKQMEREQIENAYWDGGQDVPTNAISCEDYYTQTYGNNTKTK